MGAVYPVLQSSCFALGGLWLLLAGKRQLETALAGLLAIGLLVLVASGISPYIAFAGFCVLAAAAYRGSAILILVLASPLYGIVYVFTLLNFTGCHLFAGSTKNEPLPHLAALAVSIPVAILIGAWSRNADKLLRPYNDLN